MSYCSDTQFEGRINVVYEKIVNSNNNEIYYIFKKFNETTKFSLKYEDHQYIRKQNIKNDKELLSKDNLICKSKDYKYCREFFKEIAIKNKLFSRSSIFEKFISNNYGEIKLNYNSIIKED